jgi:hypothetical protein
MLEVGHSDVHFVYVIVRDLRQFSWPSAAVVPDAVESRCHCEASAAVPVADVSCSGPLAHVERDVGEVWARGAA